MTAKAPRPARYSYDATQDFSQVLNDSRRWVYKHGVPVFKCHQRVDPNTGRLITVDLPKLYRIADKINRLERAGGVPIRLTIGHTEPGKPETQQPPIGGYYRNARVGPFGRKGEPAVLVDEQLDPYWLPHRKNFPYRSAEYYDDTEQITGVALLTRDPYLDLGVVAYERGRAGAIHYSLAGARPTGYCLVLPTGELPVFPQNPAVALYHQPFAATMPVPAPSHNGQPHAGAWGYSPQPVSYAAAPTYAAPNVPPGYVPAVQPAPTYGTYDPNVYGYTPNPVPVAYGGPPGMPGMPPMPGAPSMNAGAPPAPGGAPGGGGPCPCCGQPMGYDDGMGQAPGNDSPFPQGQAPMIPAARNPRGQGYYGQPHNPALYQQHPQTISGLPVGYQVRLDQLQYQLAEGNRAIQVLLADRDESDTAACVAEIRRLATLGYRVGDPELYELKAKPREQRAGYLHHITQRYQKVPTDQVPPMLGDPSAYGMHPGAQAANAPMTKDQMDTALKLTQRGMDYTQACQYARQGATVPTGVMGAVMGGAPVMPGGMPMGAPAPMYGAPQLPAPAMYGQPAAPMAYGGNPAQGYPDQFAWGNGQAAQNPYADPYAGF